MTDTIPPTERNPVGAAEHDLEVLCQHRAIKTWLAEHPETQRDPGWALVLCDLNKATGEELRRLIRMRLVECTKGRIVLSPMGEQVREYLREQR